MAITCQIRFNPENSQKYFSGDHIAGEIILVALCPLLIKEIHVILEGKLYIEWEELESKNKHGLIQYYMQTYTNEDTFLNISDILLSNVMIEAGEHVYPFDIKLPESIPSSCSIKSNYIQYKLSVVLHDYLGSLKLQMIPLTIRRNFKHTSPMKLVEPVINDLQIFWWWNWFLQPFKASVVLHTSIYSPGSNLEYTIQMNNPNKYFVVRNIIVALLQYVQYTAKEPHEEQRCDTTTVVCNSHDNPCGVASTNTLTGILKLPKTLLNTSIDHYAIMISYKLQIYVDMGFFQRSGNLNVPIIIDTCDDVLKETVSPAKSTECEIYEDAVDNLILETLKDTDTLEISV